MFKRISAERIFISLSPFFAYFGLKLAEFFNIKSVCLWHLIFGKDCIGCGMGRAILSVINLDFEKAVQYNPLVVIVLPMLIFIWAKYVLDSFNNKRHI